MASPPSVLVQPRDDFRWSPKREESFIRTAIDDPGLLEKLLQNTFGKFTYDHSYWGSLRDKIESEQGTLMQELRREVAADGYFSGTPYEVRLHVLRGYSGTTPLEQSWFSWLASLPEKLEPKIVRYYDCLGRPTTCFTPFRSSDPYYMSGPPSVPSQEELGLTEATEKIATSVRDAGNAYLFKLDQSYCCVYPSINATFQEPRWESELVLAVLSKAKVPDMDIKLRFSLRDGLLGVMCHDGVGVHIATLNWDPCLGRTELRSTLAAQLREPEWRLNLCLEDGQPFDTSVKEADDDCIPMSPNALLTDLVVPCLPEVVVN